jgi:hypothetical protein
MVIIECCVVIKLLIYVILLKLSVAIWLLILDNVPLSLSSWLTRLIFIVLWSTKEKIQNIHLHLMAS